VTYILLFANTQILLFCSRLFEIERVIKAYIENEARTTTEHLPRPLKARRRTTKEVEDKDGATSDDKDFDKKVATRSVIYEK
jgi:hypothetical protein